MSVDFKISIDGVDRINKALKDVRTSKQRAILKGAMGDAVKPLIQGLKVAAPSRLGVLIRSIGARVKVYKDVVFGAVGPLTKYKETFVGTFPFSPPSPNTAKNRVNQPSKYLHLVIGGTSPHFVRAPGYGKKRNASKILHAKNSGGVPGWQHPGAKANPFMEPVANRLRSIVVGRLGDFINKRFRKELAKAQKSGHKFWSTDT